MTHVRERLLNAGILAGSILVAILIGEVAIRKFGRVVMSPSQQTTDSLVVYRLRANMRGRAIQPGIMEYRWTTNSQQIRAPRDYSLQKPPGTRRIVAIGDSYTFGVGVNDDETYAALTERALRTGCPDSVEVLNFGVGGYGLSQEVETYERYAEPFAPDVVIYGFMTNDIADNVQFAIHTVEGDSARPKPVSERPKIMAAKRITEMIPGYRWLITHSALVNGARQAYFVLKRWREAGGVDKAAHAEEWWQRQQMPDSAAWAFQRALLRRLRDRVEARGAKFLVLIMSEQRSASFYYEGRPEKAGVQYRMRQLCTELNLRCVDVGEWLVQNAPVVQLDTFYIQGDGHYTAAGMRVAARAVEPALRELLGCSAPSPASPGAPIRAPTASARVEPRANSLVAAKTPG